MHRNWVDIFKYAIEVFKFKNYSNLIWSVWVCHSCYVCQQHPNSFHVPCKEQIIETDLFGEKYLIIFMIWFSLRILLIGLNGECENKNEIISQYLKNHNPSWLLCRMNGGPEPNMMNYRSFAVRTMHINRFLTGNGILMRLKSFVIIILAMQQAHAFTALWLGRMLLDK